MGFEFVGSVEFFCASYVCPEWTFVFLEGFVDEHVPLHFVLPVERGLAQGALVRFLT